MNQEHFDHSLSLSLLSKSGKVNKVVENGKELTIVTLTSGTDAVFDEHGGIISIGSYTFKNPFRKIRRVCDGGW